MVVTYRYMHIYGAQYIRNKLVKSQNKEFQNQISEEWLLHAEIHIHEAQQVTPEFSKKQRARARQRERERERERDLLHRKE